MPRKAIWKALFSIVKGTITNNEFHSYKGSGFRVSRGTSLDHNTATLHYQEGARHFDITAEEGADGGFFMDVDEMERRVLAIPTFPCRKKFASSQISAMLSPLKPFRAK